MKWLQEFRQPGAWYRGKAFWGWNGRLEPAELQRQIRVMQRMGMGGFFMHPRVGLATTYLGAEFFECVRACVAEAKRLGMEAWLYDEDRWPSGAAGGKVTKDPRFRARCLQLVQSQKASALKWDPAIQGAFTARLRAANNGVVAADVRPLRRGDTRVKLGKGETLLMVREVVAPPSAWYNGGTNLDMLNPAGVRAFLRSTHELYRREIGKAFGQTVPGVFTDEPSPPPFFGKIHGIDLISGVPWTGGLPGFFRRRYGYDLQPHLLELFFDVEGQAMSTARYHFHDCVTELFVTAFGKTIGDWCERHHLLFTGHLFSEDSLISQTANLGSCQRFYEHMQLPGIDLLGERSRHYDTVKQVSSTARQCGQRWRLTELYGITNWALSFAGHKAIGDWQAALGINMRSPHLCWYTMEGEAKRDYPASIFHQSPWWELYGTVEDYFARVNWGVSRGVEVRDLLVIHPGESMWTLCRQDWLNDPAVTQLNAQMVQLRDWLLTHHLDFDYGDEDMLARRGRVNRRRGDAVFSIGQADYRCVLVPAVRTLRQSTVELLRGFRAAGGTVVWIGDAPGFVDARPSAAARDLARTCTQVPFTREPVVAALTATCRRVSLADARGEEIASLLYQLREDETASYLFVCNTGLDLFRPGGDALPVRERKLAFPDVRVRGFDGHAGTPVELDLQTGDCVTTQAQRVGGGWEIQTGFPPLGSRLFMVPKRRWRLPVRRRDALREVRTVPLCRESWPVALSESNVLVLDRAAYRLGKEDWQAPEEVLRIDGHVRTRLKLPLRGNFMVQPWARPPVVATRGLAVELKYAFRVDAVPDRELWLALEQPQRYSILVNGTSVSSDTDSGWWVDTSLRRIPVNPNLLRQGLNEIRLACQYDETHLGLEQVFLLGDFGVRVHGNDLTLDVAPRALRLGDWTTRGLPFYSGAVSYHDRVSLRLRQGERVFVRVPEYRGTAVRVWVNGHVAGVIAWEPNEVEITGLVDGASVELRLEVFSHRRNSHGPHHLQPAHEAGGVGPFSFMVKPGSAAHFEGYSLTPCGLLAAPQVVVRRP